MKNFSLLHKKTEYRNVHYIVKLTHLATVHFEKLSIILMQSSFFILTSVMNYDPTLHKLMEQKGIFS